MVKDIEMSRRVFSCIDNTTLAATDSEASVEAFCRHTLDLHPGGNHVAAVCVYPRFVAVAKRVLAGSDIRVASVAGAFPHGQLPLELKVAEVAYAVGQGADEVDIVLSRGLLLQGDADGVVREVKAMKEACQGRTLKVILETCELPSPTLVAQASQLAIDGGADFIKTSTGKIGVGATLEVAEIMLTVINENVKKGKKRVGFKAAGGISTPEEALAYAEMAKKIMGDDYVKNQTFRIGASRLTDRMHAILT
jgi:deoxyribose-phosphate aldolase